MFRIFVVLAFSLMMLPASFAQRAQVLDFKPGEVIVGYRSEADRIASERMYKSTSLVNSFNVLGGQKMQKVVVSPFRDKSLLLSFSLPPGNNAFADGNPASQRRLIDDLASQIKKVDPRVKYVYPNYFLGIPEDEKPSPVDNRRLKKTLSISPKSNDAPSSGLPNDPQFAGGLQWDYQPLPMGMNAVGAWKTTTGDRKIVVAVVDTGILRSHPDVVSSGNLLPGYNFVSDGNARNDDPSDPNTDSHGSNVASIIGAVATNNKLDVAGINWTVSVLPVRVMNETGRGSSDDIADGVLWAAGLPVDGVPRNTSPADIINLSLGAQASCDDERAVRVKDAIAKARAAGSIIVAAAGNSSSDVAGSYPANCPGVISVAAHDFKGRLASYSNFGDVSIVAPGGSSDKNGDGMPVMGIGGTSTMGMSGTSQAAPHVAGAIALAFAKHEDWRRQPDLVAAAIRDSAVPMPPSACPNKCGPGQLDAQRLLEYVPSPSKPPLVAAVPPSAKVTPTAAKVRTASNSDDISGSWLMTQGGVLIIKESEWLHPSKGTATISLAGQDTIIVRYPQQTGVTCAYRVKLMENGTALQLDSTNASQPDEFCPGGRLTSGTQTKSARAASTVLAETRNGPGTPPSGIVGRWLMNSGGVLVIEKDYWSHPAKGSADVTLIGNDQLVAQYPQQANVNCTYRFVLLDEGKVIELVPTNSLQPDEYCPAGRLTAAR